MKRFLLAVAALIAVTVSVPAEADQPDVDFSYSIGKVLTDSLKWRGTSTPLNTASGNVDTLVQTDVDTSGIFSLGGAESAVLEFVVAQVGADSLDVVFAVEVGSSRSQSGMFHTLTTINRPTHAASDTFALLLFDSDLAMAAASDTSAALANATEETGLETIPAGERALARSMPYGRVRIIGQGEAADSVTVVGILNKRYPR